MNLIFTMNIEQVSVSIVTIYFESLNINGASREFKIRKRMMEETTIRTQKRMQFDKIRNKSQAI